MFIIVNKLNILTCKNNRQKLNTIQTFNICFQEELNRVYVQMGILRDKTVCKKNPHISKRKGGKKLPHRRFSLQVNKLCQLNQKWKNVQNP